MIKEPWKFWHQAFHTRKGSTRSCFQATGAISWWWPRRQGDEGAPKPSSLWKIWWQLVLERSSLGDGGECSPSRAEGLSPTLWWHRRSCHTLSRALTVPCPFLRTFLLGVAVQRFFQSLRLKKRRKNHEEEKKMKINANMENKNDSKGKKKTKVWGLGFGFGFGFFGVKHFFG